MDIYNFASPGNLNPQYNITEPAFGVYESALDASLIFFSKRFSINRRIAQMA
jgi:hypothetical protein